MSTIFTSKTTPHTFKSSILDHQLEQVTDMALEQLQKAGMDLAEWRAALYRRMNYSFLVSDDRLKESSVTLSGMGLPLSTPQYTLKADGDFQAKGRFHCITRAMSPATIQHVALYPQHFLGQKFTNHGLIIMCPRRDAVPYIYLRHLPYTHRQSACYPSIQAVFDCVCSILRPVEVD